MERYSKAVEEKTVTCELETCLRCGKGTGELRLHDRRKRTFRWVLERLVKKVVVWLARWKCRLCGATFTLYPPFALPYKRYVTETVTRLSESYLEKDELTYRKAVLQDGMPVFHEGAEGGPLDERTLQHSTLYRWFSLFGALERTRREALRLIRQRSSRSGVFRRILPIAPWKYRSDERRKLLGRSRQLFSAEKELGALFGTSIFPRFATLWAWS
ncbi:MAG: hypothetical protein HY721_29030 [Planctomycetes bacterium]|nr:hypothetical protein [Planctomycetota bacterium]